jgi:hypothetical protein
MSQFTNLSDEHRAKVNAKLAELQQKTGRSWSYEVIDPESRGASTLLEITVDGKISKPLVLDGNDDKPADRICSELDRSAKNN